ncbi:transposase [Citrobacter portucalensis]|uniref:transposase n=1 Tax=Citrobacter portucalensis TaxID=1639133 RepID=UPI001C63C2B9|nr:transposase [Citrobacter portucalensis]MBW7621519.1 transposase [Citrobacter portucalensis]MBW7640505.1 transposase [Citrobacter portucalensis]MCA2135069.1 transposase [Citrobacter portucalensis]MCA2145254.1 transposase [Citrobacter portucalensis]MCA2150029.1 transposase [Citrobacter portucalensis]
MIRDEHEKEIDSRPLAFERVNLSGGKAHRVHKQQEEIADRVAREEWERKTRVPSEIITVYPEPTELPDICKTEALIELEKRFYPLLKLQRIKLDMAYDNVKNFEETEKPTDFDIEVEIRQNPFTYYSIEDNDGFGTARENVSKVLQNIPEGFRLIDVRPASRGTGSYILLSDKTHEEICQLAEKNLLERHSKQLNRFKQELANQLKAMKQLISDYETQKKQALQADIEQLVKLSGKYAKAI